MRDNNTTYIVPICLKVQAWRFLCRIIPWKCSIMLFIESLQRVTMPGQQSPPFSPTESIRNQSQLYSSIFTTWKDSTSPWVMHWKILYLYFPEIYALIVDYTKPPLFSRNLPYYNWLFKTILLFFCPNTPVYTKVYLRHPKWEGSYHMGKKRITFFLSRPYSHEICL